MHKSSPYILNNGNEQRNVVLDIMKGITILLMIYAHILNTEKNKSNYFFISYAIIFPNKWVFSK